MSQQLSIDSYALDVLMRDLVGHDRAPSAYCVYLWLWGQAGGQLDRPVRASLQMIAAGAGLSKSSVQSALRRLVRRGLLTASRTGPTEAPAYRLNAPWRRQSAKAA